MNRSNFFSGTFLDRSSELRTDTEYLKISLVNPDTKYILFHKCNPIIEEKNSEYVLLRCSYNDVKCIVDSWTHLDTSIFEWPESLLYLGRDVQNHNWFALNLIENTDIEPFLRNRISVASGYFQALLVSWEDAPLIAQAKSMFHWLDRYKFCATCGLRMRVEEAGYKRTCPDKECRSNKGVHNTCYPRTDPTVIMCVVSENGHRCLLGRKVNWPKKQYSCLAGFLEPGESIEEAVQRETKEESGKNSRLK